MVQRSSILEQKGLKGPTRIDGSIGGVTVAIRPPDPMLIERLVTSMEELRASGILIPQGSKMGIRSVDGFYYFPDIVSVSSNSEPEVVSIIEYDPVNRTFLLSGDGDPDDTAELFWFGFETFPESHVMLEIRSKQTSDTPNVSERRLEHYLNIMREWKRFPDLQNDDMILWRGVNMSSMLEKLRSLSESSENHSRSQ